MKRDKLYYCWRLAAIVVVLFQSLNSSAQVVVEQTVDSVGIFIGQQAHLTVSVTAPRTSNVTFSLEKMPAMLVPGVEVLSWKGDTAEVENEMKKVRRIYTITSFDEALYALPPVKVTVDGKSYQGAKQALKVVTLDVDTLHPNQFFPPKDVQDNPFLWKEWNHIFWLSMLVLLLMAAGFYLIVRLKENKPIVTRIRIVKRLLPHQKAMNAIDTIKAEQMAASEDQKEYYTRLTDALRQYIEERFGFSAMEMTSSEIIEQLQTKGDRTMTDELSELFRTADLVKFAKYSTLLGENDRNLVNAIQFIDQTKQENLPTEERIVPQLSESDKKTRKNRITIKWVLVVLATIIAVLVAYICLVLWMLGQ